jgi:hypothetical protein
MGTIGDLVRKSKEQAEKQEARFTAAQWVPPNTGNKRDVCSSLTAASHHARPFCTVSPKGGGSAELGDSLEADQDLPHLLLSLFLSDSSS